MSDTIAVLVTITGDRGTLDDWVNPERSLDSLLPSWAAACSSAAPEELVVLAEDGQHMYDLSETVAGIGLAPGAGLRLARVDEAADLAGVGDLPPSPDQSFSASSSAAPDPWEAASLAPPQSQPVNTTGRRSSPPVLATLPTERGRLSRLASALGAAASPRSFTDQPAGPFARAATVSAGERFRRSWRSSDRIHALEELVRSVPLRRCLLVAVVSPKGGVGKTTITALTGMLLAELRRDPVLAVDANPDYGNLRDKLAGQADPPAPAVDELAGWLAEHPNATPTEVAARLGTGPHGLRYVPTPWTDPGRMVQVSADFELYQSLLHRLRSYEGLILVDCGTGLLDPPVRAAIEAADQILLVTDSAPDSAGLVVAAADLLPADTPTWLVANKMPAKGSALDLEKVAAAIPRLGGVTVVPEVRLAENVVTASFRWEECPPAWRAPIREVAARLALDWPLRQ